MAAKQDPMKMLHMMMPYMDPSSKRMLSIMIKIKELQDLMAPEAKPEQTAGEEKQEVPEEMITETTETAPPSVQDDLATKLQEGLTPEQRNMITSLSGMLK